MVMTKVCNINSFVVCENGTSDNDDYPYIHVNN